MGTRALRLELSGNEGIRQGDFLGVLLLKFYAGMSMDNHVRLNVQSSEFTF